VIVPTLNEERNLPMVFAAIPHYVDEVILVDGHSTDGTIAVARKLRPDVRVIDQTRRGKGNALACGMAAATGDIIITLDADGSTDPGEIPRFLSVLRTGADFAKGCRFMQGGGGDITRLRRIGNGILCRFARLMFRTWFSDLCYGYNAFWRHCLPALGLDHELAPGEDPMQMRWGDGFEIETLINVRVAMAGLNVAEVPSFERQRLFGQSNLNATRDGIRVLRTLLRERLHGPVARPASAEIVTAETIVEEEQARGNAAS
jgi:glycosyltransferase involved in cell wall biosynthesis